MKSEVALKKHRMVREVAETVILALLMFLAMRFAMQNFTIDGTSMEQSLHNGELILVDKWTYLFHPPARGDVVVFKAPPDPMQDYIKRVIGLPGDTITIKGTSVVVDGVQLNEPYVATQNQGIPPGARLISNLRVPSGDYFVLGDNRAVSSDSRIWGFLPARNIIGRAAFVYWPLGQRNAGFLPGQSHVFAGIERNNAQASGPLGVVMANLNTLWLFLIPALLLVYLRRKSLKRWLTSATGRRP
ncbi:MAG TPA: signal peptidase I [Ktedonobacteraceae bacterium]|jgi:signal peptidase I